jgi:hypothetical protein
VVAASLNWAAALAMLGLPALTAAAADRTLGSVLKDHDDELIVRAAGLERIVDGTHA